MRVLDLFSGIGGFSLGLERAGMRTVAFCEIDPYCRKVLAKHWPGIPVYDDIRTLTAARLAADGIAVDLVCGGFPCTDISLAGKGAGIDGAQSGLWSEMFRVIGELRPRYVLVENVAALLGRGVERVCGDLASILYDCEGHAIPAASVGAPHRRDRVWIVAYPQSGGNERPSFLSGKSLQSVGCDAPGVATQAGHADGEGQPAGAVDDEMAELCGDVADAIGAGLERRPRLAGHLAAQLAAIERGGAFTAMADADGSGCPQQEWPSAPLSGGGAGQPAGPHGGGWSQWESEPAVGQLVDGLSGRLVRFAGRVATGVPNRVSKLRALGNAVVPQIPELIGRAIMNARMAVETRPA